MKKQQHLRILYQHICDKYISNQAHSLDTICELIVNHDFDVGCLA